MAEDYPQSLKEFEARFATEAACFAYLAALRWPEGFVCPQCGATQAWQTTRGLWHCRQCTTQTSVTAWRWLHKLRRAMVRPGRDQLAGCVQVDETYLGGRRKPGKRGRGAAGKTLVAIAVEDKSPAGIGRIRLQPLPDASAESLGEFVRTTVAPGSRIHTDDWGGYGTLVSLGYPHRILRPKDLKLPHLVASLLKRWLLGTYQGAVKPTHLAYYLDEFTFRFNRRTSRSRGKLFYRLVQHALLVDPIPGKSLNVGHFMLRDDDDFDESNHGSDHHN
jgi:transposase-like protein